MIGITLKITHELMFYYTRDEVVCIMAGPLSWHIMSFTWCSTSKSQVFWCLEIPARGNVISPEPRVMLIQAVFLILQQTMATYKLCLSSVKCIYHQCSSPVIDDAWLCNVDIACANDSKLKKLLKRTVGIWMLGVTRRAGKEINGFDFKQRS